MPQIYEPAATMEKAASAKPRRKSTAVNATPMPEIVFAKQPIAGKDHKVYIAYTNGTEFIPNYCLSAYLAVPYVFGYTELEDSDSRTDIGVEFWIQIPHTRNTWDRLAGVGFDPLRITLSPEIFTAAYSIYNDYMQALHEAKQYLKRRGAEQELEALVTAHKQSCLGVDGLLQVNQLLNSLKFNNPYKAHKAPFTGWKVLATVPKTGTVLAKGFISRDKDVTVQMHGKTWSGIDEEVNVQGVTSLIPGAE